MRIFLSLPSRRVAFMACLLLTVGSIGTFAGQESKNRCITLEVGRKVWRLSFLDDDTIACSVYPSVLQEWSIKKGKEQHSFQDSVLAKGFIPWKKRGLLVTSSSGGRLEEVRAGKLVKIHGNFKRLDTWVIFPSSSGKRAAMVQRLFSEDKWFVHIIELDKLAEVCNLYGVTGVPTCVAVSPDDKNCAAIGEDFVIWDLEKGKLLKRIQLGEKSPSGWVAFSPKRDLLCYSYGNRTVLLKSTNFEVIKAWEKPNGGGPFCFSRDGNLLVLGGSPHNSYANTVWDIKNLERIRQTARLKGHTSFVNTLEFSPDDSKLASGGYDGTIRVWDIDRK